MLFYTASKLLAQLPSLSSSRDQNYTEITRVQSLDRGYQKQPQVVPESDKLQPSISAWL